jgi:hypothetical protein
MRPFLQSVKHQRLHEPGPAKQGQPSSPAGPEADDRQSNNAAAEGEKGVSTEVPEKAWVVEEK